MLATLAAWRKSVAALAVSALSVLTFTGHLPFLPASLATDVGVLVAFLTPVVTWLVPNTPAAK